MSLFYFFSPAGKETESKNLGNFQARHTYLIPIVKSQRQVALCEFKFNLVFIESNNLARDIDLGFVSNTNKAKEIKMNISEVTPIPLEYVFCLPYLKFSRGSQ